MKMKSTTVNPTSTPSPPVDGQALKQAFLDAAAIALHAKGVPLISVYTKAEALWEARELFLKVKSNKKDIS
jgi:hypothetical protein